MLCVDPIGPYSITTPMNKEISLLEMTMTDPATGWFEITEIPDKSAKTIRSELVLLLSVPPEMH